MRNMDEKQRAKPAKRTECACESCLYYEEDNEDCRLSLDEDELLRFSLRQTSSCPYYKFYDEYKSVRKQN